MFPVESSRTHVPEQPWADEDTPEYRINLTLAVADAVALWSAAAAKAMQAPGMTAEDVYDTLGPREAPEVAACLAMLLLPLALPGCRIDDFQADATPARPALPGFDGCARMDRKAA